MRRVILSGNIGRDPEIKTFQNGGEAMSFNLAVFTGKKKPNSNDYISDWYVVQVAPGLINSLRDKLFKGSKVIVDGLLYQKQYTTRDGRDGISMVVEYASVEEQKNKENQNNNNNYNQSNNNNYDNNDSNNSYSNNDYEPYSDQF